MIIDCCVNIVRLLFNSSPLITAIISFSAGPLKKQNPSKFCKKMIANVLHLPKKSHGLQHCNCFSYCIGPRYDHSLPSRQSTTSYFGSNKNHVVTNNLMCYNHPFFVPNDHFSSVLGGSVWNEIGISANSAN